MPGFLLSFTASDERQMRPLHSLAKIASPQIEATGSSPSAVGERMSDSRGPGNVIPAGCIIRSAPHRTDRRARLLGSSALAGGRLRALALAAGVAAVASFGAGFASAADYAAGGGVNNAPGGNATAVGSGAQTTGVSASAFGNAAIANGISSTAIGQFSN